MLFTGWQAFGHKLSEKEMHDMYITYCTRMLSIMEEERLKDERLAREKAEAQEEELSDEVSRPLFPSKVSPKTRSRMKKDYDDKRSGAGAVK